MVICLFKNLIEKYVNNMNINDLIAFSHKENIYLENNEYLEIYDFIKSNWDIIIKDSNLVKDYLYSHFNDNKSSEIYNMYLKYKKKYSAYL